LRRACGRRGAGFPTGIKRKTMAQASPDRKYIVYNAEGDSSTRSSVRRDHMPGENQPVRPVDRLSDELGDQQ
jgi:NADH:ubiquinone oxidoreductase subunit F (NADH-binding)